MAMHGLEEIAMKKQSTSRICLIVSGDPTLRRKLCLMAEQYGFETLEAAGATPAQMCIEKHRLVVVVFGEGENDADTMEAFNRLPSPGNVMRPKTMFIGTSAAEARERGADIGLEPSLPVDYESFSRHLRSLE